VDSWVTRDPARMTPLENSGPDRVGNKQPERGTVAWVRLDKLSLSNHPLDVHGDRPYDACGREDGLRLLGASLRLMEAG